MVDLCPVSKRWSENQTKKACVWSKMSGIRMVRQVMWLPFEYPDTHTVWYSYESSIHVFGIHMVTVQLVTKIVSKCWWCVQASASGSTLLKPAASEGRSQNKMDSKFLHVKKPSPFCPSSLRPDNTLPLLLTHLLTFTHSLLLLPPKWRHRQLC